MAPSSGKTGLVIAVFVGFCSAQPATAQDKPGDPAPKSGAFPAANPPGRLTGKERLGRKWMDEQRIDNCNVPIDKRGTKSRSSVCHPVPTG